MKKHFKFGIVVFQTWFINNFYMIQQNQVEPDRRLFRKLLNPFKTMLQSSPHIQAQNLPAAFRSMMAVMSKFEQNLSDELDRLSNKIRELQIFVQKTEERIQFQRKQKMHSGQKTTIPRTKVREEQIYRDQMLEIGNQIKALKHILERNHDCELLPYCEDPFYDDQIEVSPFQIPLKKYPQNSILSQYEKQQQYLEEKIKRYRRGLLDFLGELKEFKKKLEQALPCEACELKELVHGFLGNSNKEVNLLND